MQTVSELALPHLALGDPTFAVDPMPYIEAARREHPWLAKCDFGYVVHEYQAIKDLSYMDDKLRPSMDTITEIMGAKGTPWGEFMDNLMLAKTGAEHARIRSSVEASFTPKNISRYRPLMRDRVSRLLDEWAPKGAFDFAEFAAYFPMQHPEHWARCAEDRPFCDQVVREMLRHTSVSSLYRMTTHDLIYRDVLFPSNTLLFMPLNVSGRDPTAFPDPMEFRPERPDANRHMAFGRGAHMCLGQHLARAQIQEGIHLIAQRITKPRLAGEITWRPFPGVWGIRRLPIAFEPGPRRPAPEPPSVGVSEADACPFHP